MFCNEYRTLAHALALAHIAHPNSSPTILRKEPRNDLVAATGDMAPN